MAGNYTLAPGSLAATQPYGPAPGAIGNPSGAAAGSWNQTPHAAFGLASNVSGDPGAPQLDPNAFNYGGVQGGASAASGALAGVATDRLYQNAPQLTATQVQNGQAAPDAARFGGAYGALGGVGASYGQLAGQYGNLGNFYQGMVNGTAPSLAQAQLNQATDQNINTQFALANSGRGGLGGAAGQAAAQQNAALVGQQAAQQAVATNLQQQQVGAQGLAGALSGQGAAYGGQAGVYGQQGGLSGQQEQFNQGAAQYQAGLNQQTNLANASNALQQTGLSNQFYLGANNLANNIQGQQLQAQIAGEQLQSGNQLQAQQLQEQQAQFNAKGNTDLWNNVIGTIGKAGSALAFDADLIEPNKPAGDMAHWTLREEPDFLLAINQRTGELRKLATQPLSPAEHRQAVNRPHGAGPLGADDPQRMRMDYSDVSLGDTAAPASGSWSGNWDAGAGARAPAEKGGGGNFGAMLKLAPLLAADLDLDGTRRRYHDAPIGDPWSNPAALSALGIGDLGSPPPPAAVPLPRPTAPSPSPSDPLLKALWSGQITGAQYDAAKAGGADPLAASAAPPSAPAKAPAAQATFRSAPAGADAAAPSARAMPLLPATMGGQKIAASVTPTIDPAQLEAIRAAGGEGIAASEDLGRAQAQQLRDAGTAHALKADTLGTSTREAEERAATNDAEIRGIEDHVRDLSDEYADSKVDQDGWWKKQSTGDRIRYGIAMMFGALASWGQPGGANPAMEQINRHIDKDLEEQKAAIERKKGKIADAQGLLASAYRRTGNMDQAMATAKAFALQQADEEQQAFAANANSQSALAQAKLNSAHFKMEIAKTVASGEKYTPAQTVGGTNLAADYHKYADELLKAGDKNILPFNEWLATRSGAGGGASTPKQVGPGQGAGRLLRNIPGMQANVEQLRRLEVLESQRYMTEQDKAEARAIRAQLGPDAPPETGWIDRTILGQGGTGARATRGAQEKKLGHTIDVARSGAPDGDGEQPDDVEGLAK